MTISKSSKTAMVYTGINIILILVCFEGTSYRDVGFLKTHTNRSYWLRAGRSGDRICVGRLSYPQGVGGLRGINGFCRDSRRFMKETGGNVAQKLLFLLLLYLIPTHALLFNTFAAIVDLSRFNNSCSRLLKISHDNNE
jgi:hypothetical protein